MDKMRAQNFGFGPLGTASKGEKIFSRLSFTIMQNFTPLGATVAKMSATGQRKNTATNTAFDTDLWRIITRHIRPCIVT